MVKNNTNQEPSQLPPDFLNLEKLIHSKSFLKLKSKFEFEDLKILFINPVDFLDVYFLMAWLYKNKIEKFRVDLFSPDHILRGKVIKGLVKTDELLDYCSPQGLLSDVQWAKKIDTQLWQIDPRLVLKVQCHWDDHLNLDQIRSDKNHHLMIIGPVVSVTYDNNISNSILPCYEIIFSDLKHENNTQF